MSKKKPVQRVKHVPQRTCVGCREVLPKRTMIRIVRTADGVQIDPTRKLAGRGAYRSKPAVGKAVEAFEQIPVIVVTARNQNEYLQAAFDAGASDFVSENRSIRWSCSHG